MKFSIITVTLNSLKFIQNCIESLKSQTYKNYEHIIIDGKSIDGTVEFLEKCLDIKYISEKDKGIYDAINKGIKMASGDVIGMLHSDDFYASKNVLEYIAETMSCNNVDSCYGDLKYVWKNNPDSVVRYWKSGSFKKDNFEKGWMPPHPTFFVKREVYLKYGLFDLSYKISADYELILRFLYKNNISTFYLPKCLVNMRIGGKSNNLRNIFIKMREDYCIAKKYGLSGFKTLFWKNFSKISQFKI